MEVRGWRDSQRSHELRNVGCIQKLATKKARKQIPSSEAPEGDNLAYTPTLAQ